MAAKSCAEALANSVTADGAVIALKMGASVNVIALPLPMLEPLPSFNDTSN